MILIISDYDTTYINTVCQYDQKTNSLYELEIKHIDRVALYSILDLIMTDHLEYLEQYKTKEYEQEYALAMKWLRAYDDVILCQDGNILHSAECRFVKNYRESFREGLSKVIGGLKALSQEELYDLIREQQEE